MNIRYLLLVNVIAMLCMAASCGPLFNGYTTLYAGKPMKKSYDERSLLQYDSVDIIVSTRWMSMMAGGWAVNVYLGLENHSAVPVKVYPDNINVQMKGYTIIPEYVTVKEHYDGPGTYQKIDTATRPVTIQPGDSCYMRYFLSGSSKMYYRTARKNPEMLKATMQISKIYLRGKEVPLMPFTLVPNGCPLPDGQPMRQWGE